MDGRDFWDNLLKDTQTLFDLPPPWNGGTMAAEAPSVLHQEASGGYKPRAKDGSLTLSRATAHAPASILRTEKPDLLWSLNQVSVTGSQIKFLNNPLTVCKHPVISMGK